MEVGLYFSNKGCDLQYQNLKSYLKEVNSMDFYQMIICNKYLRDKKDRLHHPIAVK